MVGLSLNESFNRGEFFAPGLFASSSANVQSALGSQKGKSITEPRVLICVFVYFVYLCICVFCVFVFAARAEESHLGHTYLSGL